MAGQNEPAHVLKPARTPPQFGLRSVFIALTVFAVLWALAGWVAIGVWVVIGGVFVAQGLGARAVVAQWLLLLMLVGCGAVAMQFTPYAGIYRDGVYGAAHTADPLYPARAGFVGVGLVGSVLCTSIAVASLVVTRPTLGSAALELSIALCALVVGWRCMPYWANGVFQAYLGNAPVADFDPKALIPMVWIGDWWRLGLLPVGLAVLLGVPVLFGAAVKAAIGARERMAGLGAVVCLSVVVTLVLVSPRYGEWVLD